MGESEMMAFLRQMEAKWEADMQSLRDILNINNTELKNIGELEEDKVKRRNEMRAFKNLMQGNKVESKRDLEENLTEMREDSDEADLKVREAKHEAELKGEEAKRDSEIMTYLKLQVQESKDIMSSHKDETKKGIEENLGELRTELDHTSQLRGDVLLPPFTKQVSQRVGERMERSPSEEAFGSLSQNKRESVRIGEKPLIEPVTVRLNSLKGSHDHHRGPTSKQLTQQGRRERGNDCGTQPEGLNYAEGSCFLLLHKDSSFVNEWQSASNLPFSFVRMSTGEISEGLPPLRGIEHQNQFNWVVSTRLLIEHRKGCSDGKPKGVTSSLSGSHAKVQSSPPLFNSDASNIIDLNGVSLPKDFYDNFIGIPGVGTEYFEFCGNGDVKSFLL